MDERGRDRDLGRDAGPHGTDFHRPLSAYLNELSALGCALLEFVEPALPHDALRESEAGPGAEAYVDVPNFVVIASRRENLGLRPRR